MRFFASLTSILFALLLSSLAFADESLTWEACVKEALENNLTIKMTKESLEKAGYQLRSSEGAFYPQVSASMTTNRNANGNSGTGNNLQGSSPDQNSDDLTFNNQFSYGLNVKQSLFNGFKDSSLVSKRSAELEGQEAEYYKQLVQLGYDLRTAFVQVLYFQDLTQLNTQTVERRKTNLRMVELRIEGGREHKGAFLKSEALFMQAVQDLEQSKRGFKLAQEKLSRILGRSPEQITSIRGAFQSSKIPPKGNLALLSKRTPSYLYASAMARAASYGVDIAKSVHYPDIAATASATKTGETWPPESKHFSVGLSLTLPLYSGGSISSDVEAAARDKLKSETSLLDTERETLFTLEQAYSDAEDALGKLSVQEKLLSAAQTLATISRNQYTLGLTTFQEWDTIENEYITSQRQLLTTKRDSALTLAAWEKSQGIKIQELKYEK